jgi:hypothetical protein
VYVVRRRADCRWRELVASGMPDRQTQFFEIVPEDNATTGRRELTCRNVAAPPVVIGLVIGDVIHNLRTALDHLMCRLVEANGETPDSQTYFPIKTTEPLYTRMRGKGGPVGVSDEVRRRLDSLAPYPGGEDALVDLHLLDIADKHNLLLTASAAMSSVAFDWGAVMANSFPENAERFTEPIVTAAAPANGRASQRGKWRSGLAPSAV